MDGLQSTPRPPQVAEPGRLKRRSATGSAVDLYLIMRPAAVGVAHLPVPGLGHEG